MTCATNAPQKRGNEKHEFLLEEFELVTETEEFESEKTDQEDEERRMKEYDEFVKKQQEEGTDVDLKNVPDEEFEKYVNQTDDDPMFRKFKKRIANEPEQVS